MQARAGGTLNRPHRIAADVANHDLRARAPVAVSRREPIYDLCAVLRARRPERFLAQAAATEWRLPVFVGDHWLEQVRRRRDRAVGELLERQDVHDPERAAVRRRHQVALARMNPQIVHGNGGEARHEALPRGATVERDIGADVGAHEEEVAIRDVFANHVHVVRQVARAGQIVDDRLERLAEVGRNVDVGCVIAVAVVVERDVEGCRIEVRRLDAAHVRPRGNTRETAGHTLPRATVIPRDPNVAVVRANEQQPWPQRRLPQ